MNDEGKKSTLIAHNGTEKVTFEQLKGVATPPSTRFWRPVSHVELIETIKEGLSERGFVVEREDYAIGNEGQRLFGTMDLHGEGSTDLITDALGLRHDNVKRMAQQIIAGKRIFVCDNMAFSGDVTILKQKHTWGYNLRELIQRGLDSWQRKRVNMAQSIERMQNTPINDTTAQAILGKALYDGVTTFQVFKVAYDLYFEKAVRQPELYPDCAPRSAWGLHNAYTRAIKLSTINVQFETNIELGKLFNL